MKYMKQAGIWGMALVLGGLAGVSQAASLNKTVYSPEAGVVCDKSRKAPLCADRQGLSISLTEVYLGKAAAERATKLLAQDVSLTVFTFSNGLYCDTNKHACFVGKYSDTVDRKSTLALFGALPKAASK